MFRLGHNFQQLYNYTKELFYQKYEIHFRVETEDIFIERNMEEIDFKFVVYVLVLYHNFDYRTFISQLFLALGCS
jgi:hypothetical protein